MPKVANMAGAPSVKTIASILIILCSLVAVNSEGKRNRDKDKGEISNNQDTNENEKDREG